VSQSLAPIGLVHAIFKQKNIGLVHAIAKKKEKKKKTIQRRCSL
jgi:hypothetical protein